MQKFFASIAISFISLPVFAQQPLPDFKVSDAGKNKVRIEWVNPYKEACIQLNIQRSFDSVTGFVTVFGSISPELPRNGYVDEPPAPSQTYYRIFYVLTGGAYYFTDPKKMSMGYDDTKTVDDNNDEPEVIITVRNTDSVIARLTYKQFVSFRDSVISRTRDTLMSVSPQEVLIKYFNPENIWVPSLYIFTGRDGNVKIQLPGAKEKKYRVEIFDETKKHLFTLSKIHDNDLTLEKVNFLRAGWFYFELYEGDQLKEKNKFYIEKDFYK